MEKVNEKKILCNEYKDVNLHVVSPIVVPSGLIDWVNMWVWIYDRKTDTLTLQHNVFFYFVRQGEKNR